MLTNIKQDGMIKKYSVRDEKHINIQQIFDM